MRRVLSVVACLAALPAAAQPPAVVPRPAQVTMGEGAVALDAGAAIATSGDAGARRAAARFAALARRIHGARFVPGAADPRAPIRFERTSGAMPDEGYRIVSGSGRVVVAARTDAGLQHGASTLVQLLSRGERGLAVPALLIEDAPRFPWRGLLLDSARHYQSPAFIRRFIDWMALHKLNVLQWHLTDDQAWRLEIRKYPRLTQVGAWRGKPHRYGGFYSQREVRDLVAYAAARGITIVPEIDMPGHATAAIAAYPRLAATDDPPRAVPSDWGIYPNVYGLDEATFGFLEDVLLEVMALFPSRDIHVGGDEVVKDQWLAPRGRARMAALGLDDPAQVQPYFTNRIARFLAAHGRRAVGWDEILAPGLAPGAIVMSWRGTKGADEAARRGFDTVVAAHPTMYFDNRQGAREEEPPGRVTTVTVDDVYAFDPMPAGLSADEARHVIGVQANLWTEHIRTEDRLAVMAFPRAAAVAELGWSQPDARDAADFRRRLDAMMRGWPALGLGEAARLEALRREPAPPPAPLRRTSRQLALCSQDIALMLEDDAPPRGPRAVFTLDVMNPCWIFRAAPLAHVGAIRARVGQVPFNFQVGDDVKKIHFAPPRTKAGELEVRLDTCDGEVIARLPLEAAARSDTVTTLEAHGIAPRDGTHDLCLRFAQPSLEPLWALDSLELVESP